MSRSKIQQKRGYLEQLRKRRDYLWQRVDRPGGEALTFDKLEANALTWAIAELTPMLKIYELKIVKETTE